MCGAWRKVRIAFLADSFGRLLSYPKRDPATIGSGLCLLVEMVVYRHKFGWSYPSCYFRGMAIPQ